ncbi:transmembrane protein 127-like [Bacillus rossius redtenbacheri]|uniref:transmembrane protein 127-like n=1 Tax=Bacillus rossius redtenbacheri TaxID=93214 RepID=UPI002FDF03FD
MTGAPVMYSASYFPRQRWHVPKEHERNFVAAFFHMATIALTCTSLAQLGWFHVRGAHCSPHLAVYQFFDLRLYDDPVPDDVEGNDVAASPVSVQFLPSSGKSCVTREIANLMRMLILLCFMAIISSLVGFFLDIVGPTKKIFKIIRRNSIPSIFTVVWVVMIVGLCYYISNRLEILIQNMNPQMEVQVSYEYGCYTITAAGVVAVIATACNLFQQHGPVDEVPRRRLVDDWDGIESFVVSGPQLLDTPLESMPPPPYTP